LIGQSSPHAPICKRYECWAMYLLN
jgi:hypothetical protein